jgi:uncharacterized pyridoxal phosphate-dependent enzyme
MQGHRSVTSVVASLGLKRVINAADTYSIIGGSVPAPAVIEAMAEAAGAYMRVDALQDAVGARIAKITRSEAALVSAGAAAGLAVAVAALLAGTDPAKIAALPQVAGERRRVIIQRCQRIPYDQSIRMLGVDLVEIGLADQTRAWELEAALATGAAAVVYIAGTTFERFSLPLPEVVAIARSYGTPVIVDAAAQLPPVGNLWRYGEAGADLVIFSGGKGLRGPQASGIVCGRADLVAACRANMSPNHAFGRAMKVGREQIVGLLAALEHFLALDWDETARRWEEIVASVVAELGTLPGVAATRIFPGRLGQTYPRALITWDEDLAIDRATLVETLASGDPEIHVGLADDSGPGITVNPFVLHYADEVSLVVDALRRELTSKRTPRP